MTTAAEYLASKGVSMEDALAFVMNSLAEPGVIYSTCMNFGVNSSMLAEIVAPAFPGVSASVVESFFTNNGFDGAALANVVPDDGSSGGGSDTDGLELLPDEMASLASLVTFNSSSGALSTASLRAAVLAQTGQGPYDTAFSPDLYYGGADGTFSGSDLGLPSFPAFEATKENLESIYYGTLINAFKAIDMDEVQQMGAFLAANQAALDSGDQAVLNSFLDLMISVYEDPAVVPMLPDAQISDAVILGTVAMVQVIGSGDTPALFDGMFLGMMG